MRLTGLEWEQQRHLDEVRDLWGTLGPLLQERHGFTGGVTWKTVKGYEYLARFRTDPVTHAKSFEYLGKRKPETEAIYADFQSTRAGLDGRIGGLQKRMDVAARVSKALRLGRMPTPSADALRAIWRCGLQDRLVVFGGANVFAYEIQTGLLAPREALPGETLDLMSHRNLSAELIDDLRRALVGADRSYSFNAASSEFVSSDGFRIRLSAGPEVAGRLAEQDDEGVEEALDWAFSLPALNGMVIGRDGQPASGSFLDARAFLILSACALDSGLTASAHVEPAIEAVAVMVAEKMPEPFPSGFAGISPALERAFGEVSSPSL